MEYWVKLLDSIADGTGNFLANALPACRLIDLSEILMSFRSDWYRPETPQSEQSEHSEEVYFWLDTLCVAIKERSGRSEALERMRTSYSEAHGVLVLDAELRQIAPKSRMEAAIWTIRSTWATRLWTLEEVILARLPYIQFDGGAAPLSYIASIVSINESKNFQWCRALRNVRETLYTWTYWDRVSSIREKSIAHLYSRLFTGMTARSTSKPTDEAFCLASILDLPLERIVHASPERRMTEFWSSQAQVPVNLVFLGGCRMSQEGLRWAPASLLGMEKAGNPNLSMGSALATVTREGLRYSGPGFCFKSPGKVLDWPIAFRVKNYGSMEVLNVTVIRTAHAPQYQSIRFDLMESLAVVYRLEERIDTSGLDAMSHVALLNVCSIRNGLIRAAHLGIFVAATDAKWRWSADLESTSQEATFVESEWLIT